MNSFQGIIHKFASALGLSEHTGASGEQPGKTPLLLVSASDADRKALEQILADTRWKLLTSPSCQDALERIAAGHIPVVLCAHDTSGSGWRENLAALQSANHQPRVIVLSPAGDYSLWEEVIDQGGFDVLTTPLRKADVLQTLDFAFSLGRQPSGGSGFATR
ncbi:MAG TPA: response regulator [Bryobacteraceae bacterium]|nr:response regulator [Bryobacteraceae bacterium]